MRWKTGTWRYSVLQNSPLQKQSGEISGLGRFEFLDKMISDHLYTTRGPHKASRTASAKGCILFASFAIRPANVAAETRAPHRWENNCDRRSSGMPWPVIACNGRNVAAALNWPRNHFREFPVDNFTAARALAPVGPVFGDRQRRRVENLSGRKALWWTRRQIMLAVMTSLWTVVIDDRVGDVHLSQSRSLVSGLPAGLSSGLNVGGEIQPECEYRRQKRWRPKINCEIWH